MIGDLLARGGIALLKKAAVFGFDTRNATEQFRKYAAIYPNLAAGLGWSEPSWTGKTITEASALNISTVWACTRAIADTVASLPLHLRQSTDTGSRVADEHPLDWVLYREPNSEMSALQVRQMMTAHAVTWGNAYALIVPRGGTKQTIGLWPWTPDSTRVERSREDNRKLFIHRDGQGVEKQYEASEVFHLPGLGYDGTRGYSVIQMARQSLGLASIQDEYVAKFYARGGRRPYYLDKKTRFADDEKFQEFNARWKASYGSSDTFHSVPVLEGDIELKELGMPLTDSQLLESRQFSVSEICRWFRVPPHMVGDLARSTNNNIEHQGQEFVTQTLMFWLCLWEQEIERQLLTDGEKGRYFAKHTVAALLRGDFESRMKGYASGLQNGYMNPDQVCELEDWNMLPNGAGKAYHIQLNMQTLPGTGEPTTAERAALAKLQGLGGADGQQA